MATLHALSISMALLAFEARCVTFVVLSDGEMVLGQCGRRCVVGSCAGLVVAGCRALWSLVGGFERLERDEQHMIQDSLKQDFIEKNTLVFKMDCGTSGCQQKRDADILNVMKSMMNEAGGTKDFMLKRDEA